ncbi:hypothetical protein OAH12_00605 [Cyclobacteriaceae bacterium]|nr:hypothetical protein [Cyclobacteriaceae bacterium]
MPSHKLHNNFLSYACNQSIEDFSGSLYCSDCNKTLIDFREMSKGDYEHILSQNDNVCGVYNMEQIAQPVDIKKGLLLGLTLGALSLSTPAVAQSDVPQTEQKDTLTNNSQVERDTVVRDNEESVTPKCTKKNKRTRHYNRKKVYGSRRFPFIHFRRRDLMGVPNFNWEKK